MLARKIDSADLKLLALADVARVLGVSRGTIYAWLAAGKFPAPDVRDVGRRWKYETVRRFAAGEAR